MLNNKLNFIPAFTEQRGKSTQGFSRNYATLKKNVGRISAEYNSALGKD
jgi:hypothetical protein